MVAVRPGLTRSTAMDVPAVLAVSNLTEFFRDQLQDATDRRHLKLGPHTQCYLVNLLAGYARTEALFEHDGKSLRTPMLAALLTRALSSATSAERERTLKRLADVALFWAGFYAHGFARRLVDVDYYVTMGGNAYESLADNAGTPGLTPIRPVFAELGAKFVAVVDALNELADQARPAHPDDLMRYYEIWQKTGSRRAHDKLVGFGISPVRAGSPRARH